ncbi:uncharacterized protein BDZ83DRAFT_721378 [Colletotrichum acutatum]|uniref:Uncharacterized protein n=1 Tax=Glomerella acutata TaxID=27357 RepID=A0AAD8UIN4_GLOAC|nr:uncharacterized protein BDZ83DRAFT_721378 [Colletotrichum acutatum]KAK1722419.1 hypothetical protein BDZ83DRAFT_721378 [Colletotrichum acutatum]
MASSTSQTSEQSESQSLRSNTPSKPHGSEANAAPGSPSESPSIPRPDISPASTYQVLQRLGSTFSHVQYAVCGDAALIAYGHDTRSVSYVTIICPAYAQEVMKAWAAATSGMLNYPGEPDTLGVSDEEGQVWPVKMRTMAFERSFETLPTVSLCFGDDSSSTTILTMPALVNEIALSYVVDRHIEEEGFLDELAVDLVWLLQNIIEDGSPKQTLNAQSAPAISNPIFWYDFTDAYPELAGLFYDAGYRPEGSEVDVSQLQSLPLREIIARGRSRPGGKPDAKLRRQVLEGPNLTRAELRKVIRDHPSSRRRSSGRGDVDDQSRTPRSYSPPVYFEMTSPSLCSVSPSTGMTRE